MSKHSDKKVDIEICNASNRRNYLRINDMVSMNINNIRKETFADIEYYFIERRTKFSLKNHFSYKRALHQPQMRVIEQRLPEVAQYFKFLEGQIEILATSMVDMAHTLAVAADTEVSLSAQGMGFISTDQYLRGTLLEIVLKLFPSKMTILVFAEVVRSETNQDEYPGWWTGVHFTHIHEEDREVLIKHNYRIQMQQLLDTS